MRSAAYGLAVFSLLNGLLIASASGSTTAPKITKGGTLTVAVVGASNPGFDPQGSSNVASIPEYYAIYDPLFYPNDASGGAGVFPGLALSYKTSKGGRDLTFVLRQGVKFSDGTPWNSSAFVFNIRRSWDPVQNSECIADMAGFVGVKSLGPYKDEIMFSRPNPAYISLISGAQCGLMVSPTAAASEGSQFGLHPVGTGPFTLTSWTAPSGTATFAANPHYYQKGFPLESHLVFESFGTTQSADACLQALQCQLEEITTAAEQSALYTDSSLKFTKIPNMNAPYPVWLQVGAADHVTNTPFSNPQARLAIAESINQQEIINSLFTATNGASYGVPSDGPITPGSWAYTKNTGYPKYNPTAASAIVSSLGGLKFTLNCGNIAINVSECDELQAMFQATGMQVQIAPYPGGTEVTLNHEHLFQATSLIANLPSPPIDPDIIIGRNFVSTSTLNQTGLQDPALDAAIQKTERVFSYSARKASYKAFDKIYDQALPWAMQFDETYWAVTTSTFHGVSVPWNKKGTFDQEYYVPWYSYWIS